MMRCRRVEMAGVRCSFVRSSRCMGLESWVKPWRRDRESRRVQECGFLQKTILALNHIKTLIIVMLRSGIGLWGASGLYGGR